MTTPSVLVGIFFQNSIRSREVARRFFHGFASIYPELKFELMGDPWSDYRKKFDAIKALDEWEEDRGARGVVSGEYRFEGKSPAPFYANVKWYGQGTHRVWADHISVDFNERFWSESKIERPSNRAILLLKMLAGLGSPLYGRADHWSEYEEKGFVSSSLPDGQAAMRTIGLRPREGLVDIFWLNYFGKPHVDIFGVDSMKMIESSSKETIGEGYLVVFGKDPFDWKFPEVRALQDKAKRDLDRGVFYDRTRNIRPSLNLFSKG